MWTNYKRTVASTPYSTLIMGGWFAGGLVDGTHGTDQEVKISTETLAAYPTQFLVQGLDIVFFVHQSEVRLAINPLAEVRYWIASIIHWEGGYPGRHGA